MILMILREGLKKALLVILYFTQCKLHLPSPEMELKDAWVSLLGGRLVEQLQTKHLSLTFFYLCEKELILDDIYQSLHWVCQVALSKAFKLTASHPKELGSAADTFSSRIVINHVILPVLEFH